LLYDWFTRRFRRSTVTPAPPPPLATDIADVKPRRIHLVYFALAFFDVLAVASGLMLSHRLGDIYSDAVQINQTWAQRREHIAQLAELAGETNAPGNDVFDSHDPATESARVTVARKRFDEATKALKVEITDHVEPTTSALLLTDIQLVVRAMDEMQNESSLIFGFYARHLPDEAGQRMATMDRRYADVNQALALMSRHVNDVQQQNFIQQAAVARSMRNIELLIAVTIFAMVGAAIWYGHRVAKMMTDDALRQNQALRELAGTSAQLRSAL
jgi:hypothetical protein